MKGLYRIHGFYPPDPNEILAGGFGFNILLNRDFARKALQTKLPEGAYKNLEGIANQIIGRAFEIEDHGIMPYGFVENEDKELTCLMHYCEVIGTRCNLYLEGSEIHEINMADNSRDFIIYRGHNVDTLIQAYTLLSIWLNWFNRLENHLKQK